MGLMNFQISVRSLFIGLFPTSVRGSLIGCPWIEQDCTLAQLIAGIQAEGTATEYIRLILSVLTYGNRLVSESESESEIRAENAISIQQHFFSYVCRCSCRADRGKVPTDGTPRDLIRNRDRCSTTTTEFSGTQLLQG